jgi:FAD/FMN-containing dehydrogenase
LSTVSAIDGFKGTLVGPDDPAYDEQRAVWNVLHDRRPALIARCGTPADVTAAIAHARTNGLRLAVRCGGHSLPGHSTVDGGLVIDLRPMDRIEVDEGALTVRVQGGAALGAVDRAVRARGLVVPVGVVSHTGVGGLTLGGGVGRMMRRFGLTVDSMLEAEVVLADGRVVCASERSEPELFWGLKGGGGNFGVVTKFTFRAHRLGDLVVLGSFHALEQTGEVLAAGERWMRDTSTPKELLWTSFVRKPPSIAPFVPAEMIGRPGLMSLIEWSGDPDRGLELLEQIRAEIDPPGASIDQIPYLAIQTLTDELLAPGTLRAYVKAGFTEDLTDDFVDVLVERGARLGSDLSVIEVLSMGGAINDAPTSSAAFPHRDARWLVNIPAQWREASDDQAEIAWRRETYTALEPHLSGGAYSNFMEGDEGDAASTAYGEMRSRLERIKATFDPENVFSLNQNIRPVVAA